MMSNIDNDNWCVWNDCERDPIDNQCWEGDDCPECWDGTEDPFPPLKVKDSWSYSLSHNFGKLLLKSELILCYLGLKKPGRFNIETHLFQKPFGKVTMWQDHCQSCGKYVDLYTNNEIIANPIEGRDEPWRHKDGSYSCEDGYGGLMVDKCHACYMEFDLPF